MTSDVASVLERMQRDPRAAGYPRVAMVVLATADADGAPLNPRSDLVVLMRAVHLIGLERVPVRQALARARDEQISEPTLRGIVRWASSRLASPAPLDELLAEFGADRLSQLRPIELAELTRRLLLHPPDQRIVDPAWELMRDYGARVVHVEPARAPETPGEREHCWAMPGKNCRLCLLGWLYAGVLQPAKREDARSLCRAHGAIVGPCSRCGAAVGADDPLRAVWNRERGKWRELDWAPNVKRRIPDDAAWLCGVCAVYTLRLKWAPSARPDEADERSCESME